MTMTQDASKDLRVKARARQAEVKRELQRTAEARRQMMERVVEGTLAGYTTRQLAAQIGISKSRVSQLFDQAMYEQLPAADREGWRRKEIARLDRLIRSQWATATGTREKTEASDESKAATNILRAMSELHKITGIYAPTESLADVTVHLSSTTELLDKLEQIRTDREDQQRRLEARAIPAISRELAAPVASVNQPE